MVKACRPEGYTFELGLNTNGHLCSALNRLRFILYKEGVYV